MLYAQLKSSYSRMYHAGAQARIGRENNLSDFKSAHDIETLPKFGAGSEYGREQREEARKKKFGMNIKKYNSDEQPWLLNLGGGAGKPPRRWSSCLSNLTLSLFFRLSGTGLHSRR